MRTLFIIGAMLFFNTLLPAQQASYGLIKYHIPAGWQEQTRLNLISYSGTEPETKIPVEIVIHENLPAGAKPDSSFKMEWQRTLGESAGSTAIPYAKKRNSLSGLQLAVNISKSVAITYNGQIRYNQLAVFIINKQMQAVQFLTSGPEDYKLLRPFIDDFLDAVEPIMPSK